jgi:hypothetical protein
MTHLLLAQHGIFEVVRALQRGDGRDNHLFGKLDIVLVERSIFGGSAQEKHTGRLLPQ